MTPTSREAIQPQLDIVAIGASAGGVDAISRLLARLPSALDATVLIVLHRPPHQISQLADVLSRKTDLHVRIAREGDPLLKGVCLIGDPGGHLTVGSDLRIHLLPDSFYRVHSIDALFCSLASNAGGRTIGVVLSGLLKDGTLGLRAIKEAGGVALVQAPSEAQFPEMPQNAIEHDGRVDLIASVETLAAEICRLVGRVPEHSKVSA